MGQIELKNIRMIREDFRHVDDGNPDKSMILGDLLDEVFGILDRAIIIPLPEMECKAS